MNFIMQIFVVKVWINQHSFILNIGNNRFGVTEVCAKESQGYLKVINLFILMRIILHVCT